MSIVQTDGLKGPEWDEFRIRMDSPNHLNVNGNMTMASNGQFALPQGTTAQRPANPNPGMIRFNVQTTKVELYNGTDWVSFPFGVGQDGSSEGAAAPSAKWLYDNQIVTSGQGLYWIITTGGAKQVYCDFDTQDAQGGSGWMMAGTFGQSRYWGGKNNNVTTTIGTIDQNSGYAVTANMSDMTMNQFRVTCTNDVNQLGTSSQADWYYNWASQITWKEVWAPAVGQHYLSNGSNPNVQRTCIRRFDNSYNLRWTYNRPDHKYNNITDFGYQNNRTDTSEYSYGTIGGNTAPAAGWMDPWTQLSTDGGQFEWYYVGRNANYTSRSGGDLDGTLAIPYDGASNDTTGQDCDSNNNVKVGNDDNTDWGCGGNSATSNPGNNGALSSTPMYWWIK